MDYSHKDHITMDGWLDDITDKLKVPKLEDLIPGGIPGVSSGSKPPPPPKTISKTKKRKRKKKKKKKKPVAKKAPARRPVVMAQTKPFLTTDKILKISIIVLVGLVSLTVAKRLKKI